MVTSSQAPQPERALANPRSLAVLIVDDDPGIRSSLARILRRDGYRVDLAESAAEALARDNWGDYFAILLDRRLPDNSADLLLPQIRELAPGAAVLIVTGYADLESSLRAIRNGASDYLLKPVDPAELRVRLRRLADLNVAREKLSRRDEQLRFMVNHLPGGAVYVDCSRGTLQFNAAAECITGYSARQLTTLSDWFRLLYGARADAARKQYERDRHANFPESRTVAIQNREGERRLVEFSAYHYDVHEVWLLHDVTEQHAAQEALQSERDFAQGLLDTAQAIILVLDAEGRIVQFNRFMEELSGFALADVRGQVWFDSFLPAGDRDTIRAMFQQVLRGQQVSGHVNAIVTRNGRERQIAWWARTLYGASGEVSGVLSIGHDITTLQEVQARLVQSERLAAIGQMIAGLAHESRNALQRAQACLELLSLDLDGQPDQVELTRRIQMALQELQRLYEEVRGYAAPIKLSPLECDVRELWRTAWSDVQQIMNRPDVSLAEEYAETDTICVIDRHRIGQVFRNIFENGLSVSPENGTVSIRAYEALRNGRPALCLACSDQGPGLTPEQAERIFEPFYTTKQKGMGLGMAIAKRFVEAHEGSLAVSPLATEGATIVVTLPRTLH